MMTVIQFSPLLRADYGEPLFLHLKSTKSADHRLKYCWIANLVIDAQVKTLNNEFANIEGPLYLNRIKI
jgi:hypothetical protein